MWPQATLPFCHSHANTWKVNGRPDVEVFVRRFDEVASTEEEIIRLGGLSPKLNLEIQYALQCRRDQPMLKVVQGESESNASAPVVVGGSLLDEIVRDGVRQMLAAALQAEVAAYLEAHCDQLDERGRRLVVGNGHHEPREVSTAAGAVPVRAPRVNDKRVDEVTGERRRFASAILPAWSRRSPRVAEVLPLLYLHGLSTSDFAPALEQVGRPAPTAAT